ncbi:hypothetical protein [Streptomyces sp. NPDC017230]|uniref:hypothetical protein n=1 Tax=unclassified Streptomyces TaxID=2593676 RepID=UPI003792BE76
MPHIELEKQGRILAGFYEGYFVRLHDDSDVTGGYYVFIVDDLTAPTDGGDYWVENREELEAFVESSQWEIEWLE